MTEIVTAQKWIRATLAADVTITAAVSGRIYADFAPEKTAYPLIIFSYQSGADLMVTGAARVWSDLPFLVRVVDQTSDIADIEAVADRIDAVLHKQSGSVSGGGTVHSCVRESPFAMSGAIDGINFRSLGGIYSLKVS